MLEFAKYYDCTELKNKMIEEGKICDRHFKYYICNDTHEFKIARVYENTNDEYETVEGIYLVEEESIDKEEFLNELYDETEHYNRVIRDTMIDSLVKENGVQYLLEKIIIQDEENGYTNWDNSEWTDLEEIIERVDNGFGIVTI